MRLQNRGGWSKGSVAVRASSVVGGDVVLLFLISSQTGGRHTLSVVEVEEKKEVGANSEEVK